jgi:hypothetical protein
MIEKRLQDFLVKIEQAQERVRGGATVDMRALDAESIAIHKLLKGKPDAGLQPLLGRVISALEQLTQLLEQHVETLKSKRP